MSEQGLNKSCFKSSKKPLKGETSIKIDFKINQLKTITTLFQNPRQTNDRISRITAICNISICYSLKEVNPHNLNAQAFTMFIYTIVYSFSAVPYF